MYVHMKLSHMPKVVKTTLTLGKYITLIAFDKPKISDESSQAT